MWVLQETWLISEYCDKGNLDRAVSGGRFHSKDTKEPNLVRLCRARERTRPVATPGSAVTSSSSSNRLMKCQP